VSNASRIALAYDSVATEYDALVEPDAWMRRALWRHFDRLFRAGDRIIDVGCGTGMDTIRLACKGVHVTAVDVSPGMVQELHAKLIRTALAGRVDVHAGEVTDVMGGLSGRFDGIVSSFAALNTIDLSKFAREASRLLRPGGRLVAHFLSPGHAASSFGRCWTIVRPGPRVIEVVIHGHQVTHVLRAAGEIYRPAFAADFVRRGGYALGLLIGRGVARRLPQRLLDVTARFEAKISTVWPLTSAGRFFVLDLERRMLVP
jgi:ubiquinone/menaquinone biosynthesis C-methylase UbiE